MARPLQQAREIGKLVAIGVPLVLAAFWLFPRFPSPLWGVPERALSKPGLSDDMSPGTSSFRRSMRDRVIASSTSPGS